MSLIVANTMKPPHECGVEEHPRLPLPAGGWTLPRVGDTVMFRGDCYGEPYRMKVVGLAMEDRGDPNVWDPDTGRLLPSPNPDVTLEGHGGFQIVTRQVRYRGSPGWFFPGQG